MICTQVKKRRRKNSTQRKVLKVDNLMTWKNSFTQLMIIKRKSFWISSPDATTCKFALFVLKLGHRIRTIVGTRSLVGEGLRQCSNEECRSLLLTAGASIYQTCGEGFGQNQQHSPFSLHRTVYSISKLIDWPAATLLLIYFVALIGYMCFK